MKFLFIEPFFGGSHRTFARGLQAHSSHDIHLATLPARFWKWRMRGAALHMATQIRDIGPYDGLIVSDLMSLSDFKTLMGPDCPKALVYFHENQITYPLAPGERRDVQFGFTDITTALAATRVLFNSETHHRAFFDALPPFLAMMPEFRPLWVVEAIRERSGVLHPGCRLPKRDHGPKTNDDTLSPPLIVWNHRWEHDKNPEGFFDALDALVRRGIHFRLALLGKNYRTVPEAFPAARQRFGPAIVHYGHAASEADYRRWLEAGDIVVSTAYQENFGISVVEAIHHGCFPLLPRRLSYPEIIPEAHHDACLYDNPAQLAEMLAHAVRNLPALKSRTEALSRAMATYAWENLIHRYDGELEALGRG